MTNRSHHVPSGVTEGVGWTYEGSGFGAGRVTSCDPSPKTPRKHWPVLRCPL